jgi:hypothetical protein
MVRILILGLMGIAVCFLSMPFVMTSQALDEHGITIPARIYHKSEYIKVTYSGWERLRDATIEYTVPESGGVSFFDIYPNEQQYDSIHVQQAVEVRYLLHRDVPNVPMAGFLWEVHALPVVRLTGTQNTSKFKSLLTPGVALAGEVLGALAALFIVWRITRWRLFAWATGTGVALGVGLLVWQEFPRRTQAPSMGVRRGSAYVKSLHRINKILDGRRTRGIEADQPVDVVGLEFVPEGRTEAVVAVDLIDRGSVPGLKEQAKVAIQYEAGYPRRAYIDGARRTFPEKNFSGALLQGVLSLAVLIGAIALAQGMGKAFKRLAR